MIKALKFWVDMDYLQCRKQTITQKASKYTKLQTHNLWDG